MNQNSEPNSDKQTNSPDCKANSKKLWRKGLTVVVILLTSTAGGCLIYGWYFIQRKLVPLIEKETTNYLHRPLELGKLRHISPNGASFGDSRLPATSTNPDFIQVKKVKVNLAPLHFLRTKQLKIDIILIQPNVYLEQDQTKLWTPTDFGSEDDSSGGIEVEVKSIQLQGGQLTLAAYNTGKSTLNPAIKANIDRIIVLPLGDRIKFNAIAKLIAGGKFSVKGQGNTQTDIIDLNVVAQKLDAKSVSNLLALPIELNQGELDGEMNIVLSDEPLPQLKGDLRLVDVDLRIPSLVKSFSNSNGNVAFSGSKITFNKVKTNFGEVSGTTSGSLELADEGNYEIKTEVNSIEANKVTEALELDSPVPIKGKIQGNVEVIGSLENPVTKFNIATIGSSRIDRLNFSQINADLELVDSNLWVRQFSGRPKSGGKIEGNGLVETDGSQNLAFSIFTENLAVKAIAKDYQNKLPVDIGLLSGSTKLSAQAGDLSTLRLRNTQAKFDLGNGTVIAENLDYRGGKWSSELVTSNVEFGSLPFAQDSAPTIAKGLINGKFLVSGTDEFDNLNQVTLKGKANLNTVGGQIRIPQLNIANGTWKADTTTKNLKLQRLFPDLPNEFNDNLSGEFNLVGNIPDQIEPRTLINGFGDLKLAQGEVKVDNLKIVNQDWTADAQGKNLKLKELSSATPDEFAGLVNGRLRLAGTTDNITPEGIRAKGNGSLTLPEGVFQAETLAIANGKFKTQVTPQGVDLSLFADPDSDDLELNGKLRGRLQITGKVDNLSPTAVVARGNLSFSQGIDLLDKPLSANVVWDGQRLDVLKARGDGLDAQGYIELDKSFFSDIPDKLAAVNYFEFNVPQAQWIDIRKLRITLPSWATNLDYSGYSDFSGQISGVPSDMVIKGNLDLRNFIVEDIEFDPFLTGNVQISPNTGVNLNLQEVLTEPILPSTEDFGTDSKPLDKIELVLDDTFSPITFAFIQDYVSVRGEGMNELLEFTTQNIPVNLLKTIAIKSDDLQVPDNFALQPISGKISGDFIFNQNTLATSGENVVIDNPVLDRIRGNLLQGNFQYIDNYLAIQNAEFQQRNSVYKLEGNLVQKPDDIELDGNISIDGGQVQDILIAMQIFELTDFNRIFSDRSYGDSKDLYPSALTKQPPLFDVGLEDAAVLEQIQLLSAIQGWLDKTEKQRQSKLIPPIKNLKGTFDGKINVSGSLNSGLNSEFEFLGTKWRWGNLIGEKIVTKGNLSQGILTLLPISIEFQNINTKTETKDKIKDSLPTLFFTGTFGGETQSGQFKLVDVPVKLIEQLFSLPPELGLDGLLNASASIAGTAAEPQARGELTINDATLNNTSIQSTKGSFNYKDARMNFFASSIVAENAAPLVIKGDIPYKLPFSGVEPISDRLELQVNVKDKGLALLDIVSRGELKWMEGKGEIILDISGVLDPKANLPRKIVAQGTANIQKATIAAKSLPKNLITNIDSQIFFDFDNIRVNSFEGDFGGGQILAAGIIPLSKNVSQNPLTIDFADIKRIELPKFYDGGVRGRLQILGKATAPNIAGNLTLYEGTILLDSEEEEEDTRNAATNNTLNGKGGRRDITSEGLAAVTQYENLKLNLGEDVEISQLPIFTFVATGDLNINGTFLQPSPKGTIVLQRGQVNLFTTQLNLSRDYKNTARFSKNNVLDPFVDVLLTGSALETRERTTPSEVLPTEIPGAFNVGTLETVRISAKVKGLSSQITNKIELTSSPPRSQTEIAALLAGGFVEALSNSNGTSGLANLAGSALFGSLNGEINDIFPIGELRLFPTQIIDEDRDGQRDVLAGEIAFNLIDKFSFSVLQILNTDIRTRFGFRYRLDDNFILRGSSDFQEESRFLVEFESRF